MRRGEQMPDGICTYEGCDHVRRSHTSPWCQTHYVRIWRNGDPSVVRTTVKEQPAYRSAHARLTRKRGRASQFQCVDCPRRAHHWSYDGTDPNELKSPRGQTYSLDVSKYVPRCASCHMKHDGVGANQYTPWSASELAIAARPDLSRRRAAELTGRSEQAVKWQRHQLRRRAAA
jgi:hypothetical protein